MKNIVARKVSGKKIELQESAFDGMESFSLIRIDRDEADVLMSKSHETSIDLFGTVSMRYESDDELDAEFKRLASLRVGKARFGKHNVHYEMPYDALPGTSMLIRDSVNCVIRVARRYNRRVKCGINVLPISDDVRDSFFDDARESILHNENGSYAIDAREGHTYDMWSRYMDGRYVEIANSMRKDKYEKEN